MQLKMLKLLKNNISSSAKLLMHCNRYSIVFPKIKLKNNFKNGSLHFQDKSFSNISKNKETLFRTLSFLKPVFKYFRTPFVHGTPRKSERKRERGSKREREGDRLYSQISA